MHQQHWPCSGFPNPQIASTFTSVGKLSRSHRFRQTEMLNSFHKGQDSRTVAIGYLWGAVCLSPSVNPYFPRGSGLPDFVLRSLVTIEILSLLKVYLSLALPSWELASSAAYVLTLLCPFGFGLLHAVN